MRVSDRIKQWRLAILFLASLLAASAHACPKCKDSLLDNADPESSLRMKEGYFWSYIAMSSMPFIAIGTVAVLLVRSSRKAASSQSSL